MPKVHITLKEEGEPSEPNIWNSEDCQFLGDLKLEAEHRKDLEGKRVYLRREISIKTNEYRNRK